MRWLSCVFFLWMCVGCGAQTLPPTRSPVPPTAVPPTPVAQATVAAAPATAVPPTLTPTPLTVVLEWAGYTPYVVQAGDTLESLSAQGGSLPLLVARYNRLVPNTEPAAGMPLIVPQLPGTGYTSTLTPARVVVERGLTRKPLVALTFDAGASAEPAVQILDTLQAADVQVTFFLTGAWIEAHPELVKRMVADGHELANHTFTHPDLTTLSVEQIVAELERTEAALSAVLGPEVSIRPYARPPFGALDTTVIDTFHAAGYLPIMWTLDSLDSVGEPKSAAFLADRISAGLPPEQLSGAIILAHVGSASTAEALPEILRRFAEQGYQVVPLSAVMEP